VDQGCAEAFTTSLRHNRFNNCFEAKLSNFFKIYRLADIEPAEFVLSIFIELQSLIYAANANISPPFILDSEELKTKRVSQGVTKEGERKKNFL